MFDFFVKIFQKKSNLQRVIEKELKENVRAMESLRDYDAGKKEISTADIERRFSDIRHTF